jgi:hypothetical protein
MGSRAVAALVFSGVVAVGTVLFVYLHANPVRALPCRVVAGSRVYGLDREQAANAITISTTAHAVGLPHHAVTIADAAALQESALHNLGHGDRDSLGLFQQRPSQGWGSPAQILTPSFAAESFFRALGRVEGWQTLSVNEAAQRVQHSAIPTAYAKWENEARALARATTGELPGALTCTH